MYKAGTVAELEALELDGKIPIEVHEEALKIVTMLDENYGEDRDIDFEDGGYVAIALDKEDLCCFAQNCVELDSPALEYAELMPSSQEAYLSVFYLVNEYEFGITLFVPVSITPERLIKEAKTSVVHG